MSLSNRALTFHSEIHLSSIRTAVCNAAGVYMRWIKSKQPAKWHGVVFWTIVSIIGCRAPTPSWTGTWQLNASKSSFHGQDITISISADGEYRYDNGTESTTFRCDGKFRPVGNERTQNCVKSSPTTLDKTRMENGHKTEIIHWVLSADGTSFTSTAIAFRNSRPEVIGKLVASRIAGSNGFAGRWRDSSFLQRHAGLTLRLDRQYLHIGSSNAGVDAPLNGTEVAPHGPNSIAGMTYSVRQKGAREFVIQARLNGKEVRREFLTLSDSGKTITDFWSNSLQPTATATLVYEKR